MSTHTFEQQYKELNKKELLMLDYLIARGIYHDQISITHLVEVMDKTMKARWKNAAFMANELALRSCMMFGGDKTVLKNIKQVLPLVAQDIHKLGIVQGTKFEKKHILPNLPKD